VCLYKQLCKQKRDRSIDAAAPPPPQETDPSEVAGRFKMPESKVEEVMETVRGDLYST